MKTPVASMTRARFLKTCAAAAGGLLLGSESYGETGFKLEIPEKVTLKKWELLELPAMPGKRKGTLRVTASNGAFGISRTIGDMRDLDQVEAVVKGMNMLDHDAINNAMAAQGVPQPQLAMLDIACWDLHARMLNKPLHVVLGTKRHRVLRYGDVRGSQPNFAP